MRTNCHIFVLFSFLAILFGCNTYQSQNEEQAIYKDFLNEIVDRYYIYCLNDADEKFLKQYSDGIIDEAAFSARIDSLKEIRKGMEPKCTIDYIGEFDIFTPSEEKVVSPYIKATIDSNLNNTFLLKYFKDSSIEIIVATLSKPIQFNVDSLTVPYMQVVPYIKGTHFGKGIGVLAISKAYFNEKYDKAILYYEFYCGPLCGRSEVVLISKVDDHWKVMSYLRVGDI